MRYMGSKNKISKYIVPIIQSYINKDTNGYLEPFVGGANIIDKIQCNNKIGCDIHKELISLLQYAQKRYLDIPEIISEEEYNKVKLNKSDYEDWYVGLVGFCASFGAKYFNGYARNSKNDNSGNWSKGAINNLKKQAPNLKDINFINTDFRNIDMSQINNFVIYCDIPYRDTTKYKTNAFPYDEFYEWAINASQNNVVLISEYWMPEGFKCIWEKNKRILLNNTDNSRSNLSRTEKLFIVDK